MTDSSSTTWPSRFEWVIIITFWGTLTLLVVGQGAFGDETARFEWSQAVSDLIEYSLWALLTPFIFRFVAAFPVVELLGTARANAVRNALIHIGTVFAVAIAIDLSDNFVVNPILTESSQPNSALQQIQRFWFLDELLIYLVVLMAGFARTYYAQKKERQEQAERLEERTQALETQLTKARLEALRMQLNPHFLFNTLHAVSTLVDRDPTGVRRMIARLSELLRHVLDDDAAQEVPLSQELDFLEDYLEIQSIRFQGDFDSMIDVPPDLHDAQVPNLILQPVVENAIKHGASQVRGMGRIDIQACRDDEHLVLTVTDNGPGLPAAQDDGLGLRNVRARLRELYGEDQDLHLETAPNGGTRAVLKIPYHTRASLYTKEGGAHLTATTASSSLSTE